MKFSVKLEKIKQLMHTDKFLMKLIIWMNNILFKQIVEQEKQKNGHSLHVHIFYQLSIN